MPLKAVLSVVFLSFLLDDFLCGLITTKSFLRKYPGRSDQPRSRDLVAWDAAPCRAEGEIAENVDRVWLFFCLPFHCKHITFSPRYPIRSLHALRSVHYFTGYIVARCFAHRPVFSTYTWKQWRSQRSLWDLLMPWNAPSKLKPTQSLRLAEWTQLTATPVG